MEILDIYNEKNQKTGKTVVRGDKILQDNEYIKLATLWIKCKDKYLIQKCSVEKGGEYAITGGHGSAGNDSLQQIVIEAKEELNIDLNLTKLTVLGTMHAPRALFDVYLYQDDNFPINEISLQESEVEDIKWLSIAEIKDIINKGLFRKSSQIQFENYIESQHIKSQSAPLKN